MSYTVPEALEMARELFAQEPSLVNEFGKVELNGLPLDPVEAFMFCIWKITGILKVHEQYPSFVISQTASRVVVGEADAESNLDLQVEGDKTISGKMKSIVKMLPVPRMSKKVDFYTQSTGGPSAVRPQQVKPARTTPTMVTSPSSSSLSTPSSSIAPSKAQISKLAEFFGAESETDVDRLLSQIDPSQRTPTGSFIEGSSNGGGGGGGGGSGRSVSPSPFAEGAAGGVSYDDDDDLEFPTKSRSSNTPKRAAKLAKFFGLPASEDNIGKIRGELRANSNMNFYRGCMGENVIRVHIGNSQFDSYKSLLISNLTTAEECIKMLLTKLGIESDPSHYSLLEVSSDKSKRSLGMDECPLQAMNKWTEQKAFHLKKITDAETGDDEPMPMKKTSSTGKLADFFGVGMVEVENANLKKALDALEPSGTFFELPGFMSGQPEDGGIEILSAGDQDKKKAGSLKTQVRVKLYLPDDTHHKFDIPPKMTVNEAITFFVDSLRLFPAPYRLFEAMDNGAEKLLEGKAKLGDTVDKWGENQKLRIREISDEELAAEAEAPKDEESDDDMSIISIDGEVVIFYGENQYESLSIDGDTPTRAVIEKMLPRLSEDPAHVELYALYEVHDSGKTRLIPFDECPLITKLNSLEAFKFALKKKEAAPEPETTTPAAPLDVIEEEEDNEEDKKSAASKRTLKLAGFFGVDDSKTEVKKVHQMLGSAGTPPVKLAKRGSVNRKALYKEGWLQVRRDFEELGKASWQNCWCILERGDLTICLGQRSRNESISREGPQLTLSLRDCKIISVPGPKRFAFKLFDQVRGLVLEFAATSFIEETEWMNKLKLGARLKLPEPPKTEKAAPPAKKQKTLDDFEFLKVIGRGHFGKVLLCVEKETGQVFAIKVLKKTKFLGPKEVRNLQTERRIMKGLHHPFIVGLHFAFQSEDRLYLVMEYVNGGELFYHLGKDGYFKEARARFYAAEILSALTYLHKNGIIYRDLKLENILMDNDGHMKITDFGLCKDELGVGVQTSTLCGTTEYMAPEVLLNLNYGFPVDWWSFGVVLYEMLCGTHPFYSPNRDQLFYNTLHRELRYPNWISDAAVDLLEALLERNPSLRLGSGPDDGQEIMRHPFFKSIDFKALEEKKIAVPFKPMVSGAADTSNIDEEFTRQNPVLTPIDKSHLATVPNHDFSFMDD